MFSRLIKSILICAVIALAGCTGVHLESNRPNPTGFEAYEGRLNLPIGVSFGPDGRLWRVVTDKRHAYVDYSTDMGKTFSTPAVVNADSQTMKTSGENRPDISVDRSGRVYVIYPAEGRQELAVFFSVSADDGRSFSAPVPISDKAAQSNSLQARLRLNPSGRAYVFWHDERDRVDWRQPGNAIYYTKIDGPANTKFTAWKAADSLCECCRLAVDFDAQGQPVVLARFIYPGGVRDHGLITTDGKDWASWRVSFDEWRIEACPEHGPALSIDENDRYHMAWFTQGNARQGLFYANSSDHGRHFSRPMPFGDMKKLPSHPDVIGVGGRIVLAWKEFDGLKGQIMVMQSKDGGETWSQARPVAQSSGESDYPFLLSRGQAIFLSWNSLMEGYRLIPID